MADRNRIGRGTGALAVTFAIGTNSGAISAWALEPAQERSAVTYSTSDLGMEFVSVSAGQFPMGCSEGAKPVECSADERPRHTVQITKPFELGKTETTQKQWQAVMGSAPSRYKGDTLPVEQVSFQDIQAFLSKLNARNDGFLYRLPTEAEWEYAARAGAADQFAGAKVANSLARRSPADDWAWYNVEKTQPVANKKPNAWGLYDMRGNVAEWVQDWYDPEYYQPSLAVDPAGPTDGQTRTLRGGSWYYMVPGGRISYRDYTDPEGGYDGMGFRCVRETVTKF